MCLRVIRPRGHLNVLSAVDDAALVLTCSGDALKETFSLGPPCEILYPETEWVELVGKAVPD